MWLSNIVIVNRVNNAPSYFVEKKYGFDFEISETSDLCVPVNGLWRTGVMHSRLRCIYNYLPAGICGPSPLPWKIDVISQQESSQLL